MAKTPQQIAAKWATNLAGSTDAIKAGVQAVTVSPAQKAIAAIPQFLQGIQNAVNSGRMAAALQKVSLPSWQQAVIAKGIPRIAGGATAAQPKFQSFIQALQPAQAQIIAGLTPRGDLNTNLLRMTQFAQGMAALKGTLTG